MSALRKPVEDELPVIPTDLVSIKDGAAMAGIGADTIYKRFHYGRITLYGTPGAYRVSLADLIPVRSKPFRHYPWQGYTKVRKKSDRSRSSAKSADISAPNPSQP